MDDLNKKIKKLEYHQRLLFGMIKPEGREFDRLIIEKNLDQSEVEEFLSLCEYLSKEVQRQKAEKFFFYAPLYKDFIEKLHPNLNPNEVIEACYAQDVYRPLMKILMRNF